MLEVKKLTEIKESGQVNFEHGIRKIKNKAKKEEKLPPKGHTKSSTTMSKHTDKEKKKLSVLSRASFRLQVLMY